MNSVLPTAFTERLAAIVPKAQYDAILASFYHSKKASFRVNTLKINTADLIQQLKTQHLQPQPVAWYPDAFIITSEEKTQLTHSSCYEQGFLYLQNLSSMLPPLLLNPQPQENILDLTAAPGSKTCQMACLMHNQGRIAAVEQSKTRFFKLRDNLTQQAANCVQTYLKDGATVWRHCALQFDRVLLDAPCSSEARFDAHNPKTFQYWNERKIKEMARKQWRLLESAWRCVKPGGILVYSTCSFAPEENEAIIAKLIKRHENELQILPITLPLDNIQHGLTQWRNCKFPSSIANAIRILPTDTMSGFFICSIQKNCGSSGIQTTREK